MKPPTDWKSMSITSSARRCDLRVFLVTYASILAIRQAKKGHLDKARAALKLAVCDAEKTAMDDMFLATAIEAIQKRNS